MLTAGAGRTSQSYTESGAMTDPLQEAGAWMEELSAADYHTAYMEDKMDGLREEILEMTSAAAIRRIATVPQVHRITSQFILLKTP